jgi:hypothetical protein
VDAAALSIEEITIGVRGPTPSRHQPAEPNHVNQDEQDEGHADRQPAHPSRGRLDNRHTQTEVRGHQHGADQDGHDSVDDGALVLSN